MNVKSGLRNSNLLSLALLSGFFTACTDTAQLNFAKSANVGAGIVNGYDVQKNALEASSVVYIIDQVQGFSCTGTLISDKLILTAAHCVGEKPGDLKVVFGVDPVGTDDYEMRDVAKFLAHDLYMPRSDVQNDIALIRYEGGLPVGAKVARLATLDDVRHELDLNVLAIGYGATDGKPQLEQPRKSSTGGRLRAKLVKTRPLNLDGTTLSINQSDGGVCYGDSGGPALLTSKENVVVGVASAVFNYGVDETAQDFDACLQLSEYTFVPAYLNWIDETSKKLLADDAK